MAILGPIVVRADGTVPFDDDLHPDHKAWMIGQLVEAGHSVQVDPDTGLVKIQNYNPSANQPVS
jgi:hypothetical protein